MVVAIDNGYVKNGFVVSFPVQKSINVKNLIVHSPLLNCQHCNQAHETSFDRCWHGFDEF